MEILIVEDDPQVVTSVIKGVERMGHCAEAAVTGKDALERVRQKKFDLVLLDIFLPDCMGHELIPQFKGTCPDTGIVTMTGYNTRELEWEVRQQGIIYYMTKPFDFKVLKEIIEHIEKKRKEGGKENWQN